MARYQERKRGNAARIQTIERRAMRCAKHGAVASGKTGRAVRVDA